ncbi:hypothetical protein FJ437_15875 [Mesorhizobium sp. B2-6-6]|nr:hypothetical protein FJ437_15875 [Mesorhizobium sp. B2-6-6]
MMPFLRTSFCRQAVVAALISLLPTALHAQFDPPPRPPPILPYPQQQYVPQPYPQPYPQTQYPRPYPQSSPQPQFGYRCITNFLFCGMSQPGPVGGPCFCNTYQGPISGWISQ